MITTSQHRLTSGVVILQSISKDQEHESLLIHAYYRAIRDVAWLLLLKLFVSCTKRVSSTVQQLASTWVIGKSWVVCVSVCVYLLDCSSPPQTTSSYHYLINRGSRARISGCNIVRNGFGSKRQTTPSSTGDDDNQRPVVPSGHSGTYLYVSSNRLYYRMSHLTSTHTTTTINNTTGVYIESSMCWIDDSLLAGNCLTGLSVVRGGFVSLSGSDVTLNGQQVAAPPILIEDAHDVRDTNRMQQGGPVSIRGGVVEGPVKNNYTSRREDNDVEACIVNGGILRGGGTSSSWTRQFLA